MSAYVSMQHPQQIRRWWYHTSCPLHLDTTVNQQEGQRQPCFEWVQTLVHLPLQQVNQQSVPVQTHTSTLYPAPEKFQTQMSDLIPVWTQFCDMYQMLAGCELDGTTSVKSYLSKAGSKCKHRLFSTSLTLSRPVLQFEWTVTP